MKLTGKKDMLIIGGALLLCAVAYLLFGALKGGDSVKIYVGDELYKEISLREDQTVIIEQQDCKNVICIENGGVFMQESTCRNQDCIEQGTVTPENAGSRALGSWIICLPNKVSVELAPEEQP